MCTNISIPRKSRSLPLISARTMDWATKLPTAITFVPRGQSFPELGQRGEIRWRNRLAFIGAKNSGEFPRFWDGINEAGLSAASLSLFCSIFPEPQANTPLLSSYNVVSYVLSNFKTIKEVKTALSKLTIVNSYNDAYHYIISDASGDHLIIEFINGKMKTYTTTRGVLTNDPPYDWHLTNLSLYEQLSLEDKCNTLCDEELGGSGQLGIPGDPTPQSRFIRGALLQQTAFIPNSVQESIGVARQILQTLSVPNGTVYLRKYKGLYDWTQWGVLRDHTNLSYYFYTDFNSKLYGIHFHELNLNARNQKQINIDQPSWYKDISDRFTSH
ncbi:linear amide C-N hydrolase [Paenibacillus taiwanensis]|uniref:linear amide C-N hydrolase n=1 Tax=Paenibacillus taiwanensis TaxID=401638 RepID=UPI00042954C5|nr:linear amide C-N hydrolase [Paenibacillus taiwanensis]